MAPRMVTTVIVLVLVALTARAEILRDLHRHMTDAEWRHFLGTADSEYEVIFINDRGPRGGIHKRDVSGQQQEEDLVFEAFGKPYSLRLEPNRHLLTEASTVVTRLGGNSSRQLDVGAGSCHFLHAGTELTAAVSRCRDGQLRGFVSDGEMLLDIAPLTPRLKELVHTHSKRSTTSVGFPHLARRAKATEIDSFVHSINIQNDFVFPHEINTDDFDDDDDIVTLEDGTRVLQTAAAALEEDRLPTRDGRRMIELGLYVDKAARETFLPFFDNDMNAFVDFILGFINQIQALYYLPSLGTKVDISINYLEIMETQQISHYDGERAQLLTSFCRYNAGRNKKAPGKNTWDMGLYLSGLDFFEQLKGRRSPVTMGLAVIAGVCSPKYSCVIGELGTTNSQGKPYPSAGFTSAYIMAHEIGHNLGMFHDGQQNACAKDGFIMSPSRGVKGETTWSSCSRDTLRGLPQNCLNDLPRKSAVQNHRIFRELPGQVYDAFDQCQLLLKDKDASVYSTQDLYDVCERVKCKSPNRIGYYYAGPALEGTFCGRERWCISGSCRAWSTPAPPIIQGGWSSWNVSSCTSGCIEKATGVAISRRRCDNPKPLNTERRCSGSSTNTQFCEDRDICPYRLSVTQYASQKCRELSQIVKDIRPDGEGTQVPHSDRKPWSACSIYCRLDSGTWYTPRQDLNDQGISAYFPDGTWCHNDGQRDYFCQLNECKPKVADPPLPARAAEPVPPTTTTTPFYRPAPRPDPTTRRPAPRPDPTTRRPEPFRSDRDSFGSNPRPVPASTERPRPVAGPPRPTDTYRSQGEAERDRWQHQELSASPTRFPPRPNPADWPPHNNAIHGGFGNNNRPPSSPFGNNNGLSNPFSSPGNALGRPKEELPTGGGGWFFSSDRPASTERPLLPWLFGAVPPRPTEAAPSGRWFFPDALPVASTTEASWLFGGDPSRILDGDWAGSRLRSRSTGPAWGRESRRLLGERAAWSGSAPQGQRGGGGRIRWPDESPERPDPRRRADLARRDPARQVPRQQRQAPETGGATGVRWPEGGESARWRVRPTMPTLPPPTAQRRADESAAAGGGLLASVTGLWCRFVGTCD
ncbi:A disintegrin and metalloproteinase with thrombospondin motifs adt-2-like [Amphibalanus amphitrite]|uniref:A disintegrin and metalloproteinase with thrombospondin motifs adt-2-like n=1 Tax=Amphibalanus amphitrite TaxID=1232801 RepID=UPI001C909D69|nr:A disintegrin and metalloproteinase with thrombospondin motifs adt-2-like [Amphibalanus amphitrite]